MIKYSKGLLLQTLNYELSEMHGYKKIAFCLKADQTRICVFSYGRIVLYHVFVSVTLNLTQLT